METQSLGAVAFERLGAGKRLFMLWNLMLLRCELGEISSRREKSGATI